MSDASPADRQGMQQRLQDLQREQLHVSRLSAMEQMNAAIAHEINQPLTAIMNYLKAAQHLISQPDMTPAQRKSAIDAMSKAAEQTLRAGAIIRNLRRFVEKRESRKTLENINIVTEEAVALALYDMPSDNVEVRFELEPSLPMVPIDRTKIQQALINLIHNGIEAMASSATRELTLTTHVVEPGFVHILVQDTGHGIPSDVLPQLFQPFVTTKDNGMGIGLTIAQSIIETHGGRIWAVAGKKHGTVFHIRLPQAESDEILLPRI